MFSALLLTATLCQNRHIKVPCQCRSLLRKHKELNLEKNPNLFREILWDGTEDLIEMYDCYRQSLTNLISESTVTVWMAKFEISHVFVY